MNLRLPKGQIPPHLLKFFRPVGHKPKDLIDTPHMVAEALRTDGWYLRSGCPYVKRSAMPESVQDRPATSLEYGFLLAKQGRYFWDAEAVRRPGNPDCAQRRFVPGDRVRGIDREWSGAPSWTSDEPFYYASRNFRNAD